MPLTPWARVYSQAAPLPPETSRFWDGGFTFTNSALPAFLELEMGMVDPQVYRQYKAINDGNPSAASLFLRNQAGKVFLFRQRIPIRNFQP